MPQYELVCHPTARKELDQLPAHLQEITRERLHEVASREQPTEHRKYSHLKGTKGLFRVRADTARAVCALEKPRLKVLRVGKRNGVYDMIDDIREERLEV